MTDQKPFPMKLVINHVRYEWNRVNMMLGIVIGVKQKFWNGRGKRYYTIIWENGEIVDRAVADTDPARVKDIMQLKSTERVLGLNPEFVSFLQLLAERDMNVKRLLKKAAE